MLIFPPCIWCRVIGVEYIVLISSALPAKIARSSPIFLASGSETIRIGSSDVSLNRFSNA